MVHLNSPANSDVPSSSTAYKTLDHSLFALKYLHVLVGVRKQSQNTDQVSTYQLDSA